MHSQRTIAGGAKCIELKELLTNDNSSLFIIYISANAILSSGSYGYVKMVSCYVTCADFCQIL